MLHQFHHQILVSPNGRQWRSCVSSEQNNKLQLQKNVRTPVCLCTKSAQALYRGRRGEEMGHRREGKLIMDVQLSTRAQCWPSVFVQLYNQMSEWGRPRRTSGFCRLPHTPQHWFHRHDLLVCHVITFNSFYRYSNRRNVTKANNSRN